MKRFIKRWGSKNVFTINHIIPIRQRNHTVSLSLSKGVWLLHRFRQAQPDIFLIG